MKEEPIIFVDRGQLDNVNMLCGYCAMVRGKEIVCKGGEHELSHFGFWYQAWVKSGLSSLYMRLWLFGLKQVLYRHGILKNPLDS
jgi:hypothetical protein